LPKRIGDHQRVAADPRFGARIHVHDFRAGILRGAAREPAIAFFADRVFDRGVGVRELISAVMARRAAGHAERRVDAHQARA